MHDLVQDRSEADAPAALPGRRASAAALSVAAIAALLLAAACEPASPAEAPARSSVDPTDLGARLSATREACDAGSACACLERAATLETYDGRAEALGEAARLYEKLCESSSKTRCTLAAASRAPGTAFAMRLGAGPAPAEMLACYNWAQMLGRGVLTAPDPMDADVLEKRACAGGLARACPKQP